MPHLANIATTANIDLSTKNRQKAVGFLALAYQFNQETLDELIAWVQGTYWSTDFIIEDLLENSNENVMQLITSALIADLAKSDEKVARHVLNTPQLHEMLSAAENRVQLFEMIYTAHNDLTFEAITNFNWKDGFAGLLDLAESQRLLVLLYSKLETYSDKQQIKLYRHFEIVHALHILSDGEVNQHYLILSSNFLLTKELMKNLETHMDGLASYTWFSTFEPETFITIGTRWPRLAEKIIRFLPKT